MAKKKFIIKESQLRDIVRESIKKLSESGHEGWREEDWNPNYPGETEEDEDVEPSDFEETYYPLGK